MLQSVYNTVTKQTLQADAAEKRSFVLFSLSGLTNGTPNGTMRFSILKEGSETHGQVAQRKKFVGKFGE